MKKLLVIMGLTWMGLTQPALGEESTTPSRAQVHTELGAAYYGMGKLGIALEELKQALDADSKYAPAYNMLGLVYMELREYDKAESNFKRALDIAPTDSESHNNYGWFLCQRGQADSAIVHFMAALKNPLYATPEKPYLNAGICSLKKGDEKEAEEFFQRAIRFQPPPPLALLNLAEINLRQGKYSDAQFYLEKYLKGSQPSAESLWLGARIAHRLGNKDLESSYGLQLRKRFPDSREAVAYRNNQFDEVVKPGGGR